MVVETPDAQVLAPPLYGNVIATGVSFDAFMAGYDGQHVEWVGGVVIEMAGIDERHDGLQFFLRTLITLFLEQMTGGRVLQDPMLMRVPGISTRAPDLQVLLPDSHDKLKKNYVLGPADLVVEIVSEGSQNTDRINKFAEYARAGVPEYWIIDPLFHEALFYVLTVQGEYERVAPVDGVYTSRTLPQLKLPVAVLWQEPLPTLSETLVLVQGMVGSE